MLQRKILEIKSLAGAYAYTGQSGTKLLLLRSGRGDLQGKVQIFKKVGLDQFLVDFRESIAGAGLPRYAESGRA